MPDIRTKTIAQLPLATSVSSTDKILVWQDNVLKQSAPNNLLTLSVPVVTSTSNGLMIANDKIKLDQLEVVFNSIAALRANNTSYAVNSTAFLKAYYANGTAGGGMFVRITGTAADDGGIIIADAAGQRWQRLADDNISAMDFGAKGDGVTDDTTAIQAAFTACVNKTVYFPKGTYIVSQTIWTGSQTSMVGEEPLGTRFKLTHSGIGFQTRNQTSPLPYTRHQTYKNFTIECNTSTTWGFWARRTLYCYFENINIVAPETMGATFAAFRVAGSVYLNTFVNCISDTIEESANKHAGRGWWIGNAGNEEGSVFAATNQNTFIDCRGIRANIGIELDAANGCVLIGCGGESCTTAGISVRGDYNNIISAWVEDAAVIFNSCTRADGSGGFLPPEPASYNTLVVGRPIDSVTITSGFSNTICNGRIIALTLSAGAANTTLENVNILVSFTDNGTYTNSKMNVGGEWAEFVRSGAIKVYEATYNNGDTKLEFNGGQYLQSLRFGAFRFHSDRKFRFTGTDAVLEIAKATNPGTSPTDTGYLFVQDNGSGKMQLAVRFPSGVTQVLATEP